jgi:hypothetical protein
MKAPTAIFIMVAAEHNMSARPRLPPISGFPLLHYHPIVPAFNCFLSEHYTPFLVDGNSSEHLKLQNEP